MTSTRTAAGRESRGSGRTVGLLLAGAPAVLVGLVGLAHPVFLTPDTADTWRLAHFVLLPLFPLVGGALWWVLRGESGPLAWGARVLAAGYAVTYSALDAIAGIGAPSQVLGAAGRGEPDPPIGDLYAIGDATGHVGVYALGAAALLAAAALWGRGRSPLAPLGAVVLLVGAYLHLRHHVFPPYGVTGMLLVAGGTVLLEAARGARGRPA